ncbi:MAG TPA: hypothetical protein VFE46_03275 [Pirellulales bacterium]|jgi:hypothetical protein|nr:hypothetical protein [Pirellulales bacterium]
MSFTRLPISGRARQAAVPLFAVLTLAIGCVFGLFSYRFHWFPYNWAHELHLMLDQYDGPVLNQDVSTEISIRRPQDAAILRQHLCQLLWNSNELPKIMPIQVSPATDSRCEAFREWVDHTDDVLFEMEYGLNSHVYHFVPKQPNGALVLVHAGHEVDFFSLQSQIGELLQRGYSVAAFCMPLMGLNNRPVVDLPHVGRMQLTRHDEMKLLQPKNGHATKYFVEPVIGFLNYAEAFHYRQISMLGLSGGGWTTVLAAAIEPRIQISFPVSGAYPIFLRVTKSDWGDWEQTSGKLYRTANYLELFVLGGYGRGRQQCQVVNRYDSDCFAGDGWRAYADVVRNRTAELGTGKWDIFVDETHYAHIISDAAMKKFLDTLEPPATLTKNESCRQK